MASDSSKGPAAGSPSPSPTVSTTGQTPSSRRQTFLASGIPLELAVYQILANTLDADWIEPDYDCLSLDSEKSTLIRRSVDFVASVPLERNPFSQVQVYFIVECKHSDASKRTWFFSPDVAPRVDRVFDFWRPCLWQREMPGAFLHVPDPSMGAICVRGAVVSSADKDDKLPALETALHQLREGVHAVAIDRIRLFLKDWSRPSRLLFVPILVTNAETRVFKSDLLSRLDRAATDTIGWNDVSDPSHRTYVRCPKAPMDVERKVNALLAQLTPLATQTHVPAWRRFISRLGASLSRVAPLRGSNLAARLSSFGVAPPTEPEGALPQYRGTDNHLRAFVEQFFAETPNYALIVGVQELASVLKEVLSWAKGLRIRAPLRKADINALDVHDIATAFARLRADGTVPCPNADCLGTWSTAPGRWRCSLCSISALEADASWTFAHASTAFGRHRSTMSDAMVLAECEFRGLGQGLAMF